jgi:ubiquinone/menaquinone biosynthesis C-methylase UbiE
MERLAGSPAFLELRDRIIAQACLRDQDRVLDIGAGTGLLALAAAPRVSHVVAVDISPCMCARLRRNIDREQIENVEVLTDTATALTLPDHSVDAVISNYCFHHLDDDGKRQALAEVMRVLRPGGRFVFADMMFSLDLGDPHNRAVVSLLVKRVLKHGLGGVARLIKNGTRIATGRWERPATVNWWADALQQAGFTAISVKALEHEGGIAGACAPIHSAGPRAQRPITRTDGMLHETPEVS